MIFVATKNCRTKFLFPPSSLLDPGSEIRETGCRKIGIQDPESTSRIGNTAHKFFRFHTADIKSFNDKKQHNHMESCVPANNVNRHNLRKLSSKFNETYLSSQSHEMIL